MSLIPTIGRTVHFTSLDGETYAGIITRVIGGATGTVVDLVTFGPNSVYFNHNVPFSVGPDPGHWTWPPRV
jgi:hypothetical protein